MEEIVELKNNLENFNRIGAIDSSSYIYLFPDETNKKLLHAFYKKWTTSTSSYSYSDAYTRTHVTKAVNSKEGYQIKFNKLSD